MHKVWKIAELSLTVFKLLSYTIHQFYILTLHEAQIKPCKHATCKDFYFTYLIFYLDCRFVLFVKKTNSCMAHFKLCDQR